MAKQFTWGEAVDETLRTRPTWRPDSGGESIDQGNKHLMHVLNGRKVGLI